jgi:integrase
MAVVNNRPLISEKLKSDRSYRTLYLPQGAQEALAVRREEQQMERELAMRWQETELIFSSTVGTSTHPNNFRRAFKGLIRQAGVRKIRVHDNRHTWVTLARDAGLDVEVVAERAGHDVRMTTAVYSQITEERKRKAALELDELLGSTP